MAGDGTIGRAAVRRGRPPACSRPLSLRDVNGERYQGRSVHSAVDSVNTDIAEALIGPVCSTKEN